MPNTFVPKPGQVDYTRIRWAPVVNCVVVHKNKILVVQRNAKLRLYPGFWNGISGFLDDHQSLEEKVITELEEELELNKSDIKSIRLAGIFDQEAPRYLKTWIVHAMLVEIKTNIVTLDWEAQKFAWLTVPEVRKLRLLPGFDQVLDLVAPLLRKRR